MGSKQRRRQRVKVRRRNSVRKARERARRDERVLAVVRGGAPPYEPWVMSWLSDRLGKRSRTITQADVDRVVAEAGASTAA
jgi:hypothetical protein